MSEKLYFTEVELVEIYLAKNHVVDRQAAIAGYVETPKGFIWFTDWQVLNENTRSSN
jgi:hypothetical protein